VKKIYEPILVTGAPRSGTTFVGKMLALPYHVAYVDEPFNSMTGISGVDTWFPYMTEEQPEHEKLVRDVIQGRGTFKSSLLREETNNPLRKLAREMFISRENLEHKLDSYNPLKQRYLIKDPIAAFSSEFLHKKFGFHTVVVIRHPASMVASHKRLGWRYNLDEFKHQSELMDDHLHEILHKVDTTKISLVEEAAYLWLSVNTVLEKYAKRNEKMIIVRHEDLSREPLAEFVKLYDKFNLPFSQRVQKKIKEHTGSQNSAEPKDNVAHQLKRDSVSNLARWKKILTEKETELIRSITSPIANNYYSEAEW
jgi:hypothetical protein